MDSANRASYLLDAVIRGHYRQVKFYLDAGYDYDYIDNCREGSTPLILTITHVTDDAIRNRLIALLLHAGANPNLGDRYGLTPLMHSILCRQKSSVRLLLDSKRIEIGIEDCEGNSAIMHAACLGLTDIVVTILERLTAVHRMLYLGFTAGDLAAHSGHEELVGLLSDRSSFFFPNNSAKFADPRELDNEKTSSNERRGRKKSDSQVLYIRNAERKLTEILNDENRVNLQRKSDNFPSYQQGNKGFPHEKLTAFKSIAAKH